MYGWSCSPCIFRTVSIGIATSLAEVDCSSPLASGKILQIAAEIGDYYSFDSIAPIRTIVDAPLVNPRRPDLRGTGGLFRFDRCAHVDRRRPGFAPAFTLALAWLAYQPAAGAGVILMSSLLRRTSSEKFRVVHHCRLATVLSLSADARVCRGRRTDHAASHGGSAGFSIHGCEGWFAPVRPADLCRAVFLAEQFCLRIRIEHGG